MDRGFQPTIGRARLGALALSVLVAAVVLCRVLALHSVPVYDDAFITYRYAENLAAGAGLVFNPGAPWEPILGTTTPGYAVLLSGLVSLGLDVRAASVGLNFAADALAALLVAHLLGRRPLATLLALLGLAALPQLARISAGGMESPVLLLVALAAVAATRSQRPWAPVAAGLVAAVGVSLRPECVLLVVLLGLFHLRPTPRLVRYCVPVLLFAAAYAAVLIATYGSPIPQSVVAKSGLPEPGDRTARVVIILRESFMPLWPMALALPFVAWGLLRTFARRERIAPFVAFALAIVAAYLAARPKTWGWYFYLPLASWVICAALGAEMSIARTARGGRWESQLARRPLWVGGAALLVVVAAGVGTRLQPDRVTPRVYRAIEAWAETERVAQLGRVVYASDIGAIAFFSGARVLDSEGLVWPDALGYDDKLGAVREHRPEYVFLVANRDRWGAFLADEELMAAYEPHRRFNTQERTELDVDGAALPDRWVQDYVLYRSRSAGADRR